jgi:tight adherence protein C
MSPVAVVRIVGKTLRRAVGRPDDFEAEQRAGAAALAGLVVGLVVHPVAGVFAAGAPWMVSRALEKRRAGLRAQAVDAQLPQLVDLLRLAVTAGLPARAAIIGVAPLLAGSVGSAVGRMVAVMDTGAPLAEAAGQLRALGPQAGVIADALVAAARHGTDLRPALDRLAADLGDRRRRQAEIRVRRIPVTLVFPLALCVLPALGLLTIVPVAGTMLQSLQM